MGLQTGTRLGSFTVTEPLGAGGMGEVWRATDDTLGRDVALKLLPEDFELDAERHARFEREARVLASLNHPNIATLYGLEHLNGGHVLVMELVEGEELSGRMARGPVAVDEAVHIAVQIADALEAAHEQGIVHRDLKPANIRLRPDGTVKVLDFGLAKAWTTADGDSSLSMSPTVTRRGTAAGVLLGTAAYMSPEQVRGRDVDRRADIWAFGVVLWEMLTGIRLFEGETASDVLAAVLKEPPDLNSLPTVTPPALRRLISRCLERDRSRRLQWIGDARLELEDALAGRGAAGEEPVPSPVRARRAWLPWAVAGVLAVVAAGAAVVPRRPEPAAPAISRFAVHPLEGTVFDLDGLSPGPVVVSPAGDRLAFGLRDRVGVVRVCVRELSSVEIDCLDGTENAQYPFFSPDGQSLGFFSRSHGALEVVPVHGGPVRRLCASTNGKGASWNQDGQIVFTPGADTPIYVVAAAGGEPRPITEFDEQRGDNSHRHPRFLPDGRRFLYLARSTHSSDANTVMVGSLDGETDVALMNSLVAASYASGHLLYQRGSTLIARPFDPDRLVLTGPEHRLAEGMLTIQGAAYGVFSVSENGVLAYQTGESENLGELVWLDRQGHKLGTLGDKASYFSLRLSPQGTHVALPITDLSGGTNDIWIYEIARDLRTRVTFDAGEDLNPVWSPDGNTLYFTSNRNGRYELFRMSLTTAAEPEVVLPDEVASYPISISPDGTRMIAGDVGGGARGDLVMIALDGSAEPAKFRASRFDESQGGFSADGRWVAYASDESGRHEVYVAAADGRGRHWQVSTEGGLWPHWAPGSQEIVYHDLAGNFVAVSVRTDEDTVTIGKPQILFGGHPSTPLYELFDVTPDGSRILLRTLSETQPPDPPVVTLNWTSELDA